MGSSCSCTCPASREPPRAVTRSSAAPWSAVDDPSSFGSGRGGVGRPCIRPPAAAARLRVRALRAPHRKSVGVTGCRPGVRHGPFVSSPLPRACRRGPAVAIVVRSALGRTACGHQPHHDRHGGTAGGHFLCRCPRAQSRPGWPPSSGATTPPRLPSTGGSPPPTSTTSLARRDGHDKRRLRRPPDPHELPAVTSKGQPPPSWASAESPEWLTACGWRGGPEVAVSVPPVAEAGRQD